MSTTAERPDVNEFDPAVLPAVVVHYLTLQVDPDRRAAALEHFAPDARVVDEGIEYPGADAIGRWLATTASAYTYTTTFTGQVDAGDGRWVVHARLEGNFPGGVADLRYRFHVVGALIADLVIAP